MQVELTDREVSALRALVATAWMEWEARYDRTLERRERLEFVRGMVQIAADTRETYDGILLKLRQRPDRPVEDSVAEEPPAGEAAYVKPDCNCSSCGEARAHNRAVKAAKDAG